MVYKKKDAEANDLKKISTYDKGYADDEGYGEEYDAEDAG